MSALGFGFPYTVDPGIVRYSDGIPVPATNAAIYARVQYGGPISKIGVGVSVSSGNLSVAVYRNQGKGRLAVPGARVATSGDIACPAAGWAEIALDKPVRVQPGDWLALSSNSTAAIFRSLLAAQADYDMGKGRQYRQPTAHPLPLTPSGLVATTGATVVLVGVR